MCVERSSILMGMTMDGGGRTHWKTTCTRYARKVALLLGAGAGVEKHRNDAVEEEEEKTR
jgi:hypothetical protein